MLPQKGEHTSVKIYLANQNTWRVAGGLVLKLANTRARLVCFEDNQTNRRPLNATKPKMRNLFFVRFSLKLINPKRPSKNAMVRDLLPYLHGLSVAHRFLVGSKIVDATNDKLVVGIRIEIFLPLLVFSITRHSSRHYSGYLAK